MFFSYFFKKIVFKKKHTNLKNLKIFEISQKTQFFFKNGRFLRTSDLREDLSPQNDNQCSSIAFS